jgi:hypothetical protein
LFIIVFFQVNTSLTNLNLSENGMGTEAGIAIAKSLEVLDFQLQCFVIKNSLTTSKLIFFVLPSIMQVNKRRQRAWISAALLLAADDNISANPLRNSLDALHPLICEFAGNHSPISTISVFCLPK